MTTPRSLRDNRRRDGIHVLEDGLQQAREGGGGDRLRFLVGDNALIDYRNLVDAGVGDLSHEQASFSASSI